MKRLFIFATSLLLVVSCGQKSAKTTNEPTPAPEPEVEVATGPTAPAAPTVPTVYSNAYDGFTNVRQAATTKSPVLAKLHNGYEGAEILGVEGNWTKVNLNGVVGYVSSAYVQDTPTIPVHIDAKSIIGNWSYLEGGHVMIEYSIYDDGMWLLYNDNFCEGAIVEVGKWHLEESSIVLTKTYDFALYEAAHSTTRLEVDLTTNTATDGDCTYNLTKIGWSKAEHNSAKKAFKQYIK